MAPSRSDERSILMDWCAHGIRRLISSMHQLRRPDIAWDFQTRTDGDNPAEIRGRVWVKESFLNAVVPTLAAMYGPVQPLHCVIA